MRCGGCSHENPADALFCEEWGTALEISSPRLLKAWGREERVREYLAQVIGMFQEMGMAWDLAQAEQAFREKRLGGTFA